MFDSTIKYTEKINYTGKQQSKGTFYLITQINTTVINFLQLKNQKFYLSC